MSTHATSGIALAKLFKFPITRHLRRLLSARLHQLLRRNNEDASPPFPSFLRQKALLCALESTPFRCYLTTFWLRWTSKHLFVDYLSWFLLTLECLSRKAFQYRNNNFLCLSWTRMTFAQRGSLSETKTMPVLCVFLHFPMYIYSYPVIFYVGCTTFY